MCSIIHIYILVPIYSVMIYQNYIDLYYIALISLPLASFLRHIWPFLIIISPISGFIYFSDLSFCFADQPRHTHATGYVSCILFVCGQRLYIVYSRRGCMYGLSIPFQHALSYSNKELHANDDVFIVCAQQTSTHILYIPHVYV